MNNATTKKTNHFDFINYPILLLSITVILNLRNYVSSIINFFNTVITHPASIILSIISLATTFTSVILLVLLVLYGKGKLNNARQVVGIVIIATQAISLYYPIMTLIRNPYFFTSIFETPLVSCIVDIIICIFAIWSGITILKGSKTDKTFAVTFGIIIYLLAILAIFAAFSPAVSILDILKSLLFVMMYFNLPNLFDESTKNKTIITKKKVKVLAIVIAVILCIYAVANNAVHVGDNDERDEGVCASCGRSWEAGDPSKNYINIAKTGMCKNCENNYHSMKQFLDK